MADAQNTFFKPLNETEKQSKLTQFGKSQNAKITIWKKGSGDKSKISVFEYNRFKSELSVTGSYPQELVDQESLFTFEINGLHFFGKCKLLERNKKIIVIDCSGELFKSERRQNFRLLTYPHHQVYFNIFVGKEVIDNSNIISMKTGQSETGLFKNFLEIMNDDEEVQEIKALEGYLKFRVMDISVTGLAFQSGVIEAEILENHNEIKDSVLDFNGTSIKIPKSKILYMLDSLAPDKSTRLKKAGVQFLDVDTNLDETIASVINQTLRSAEAEFEDFIK